MTSNNHPLLAVYDYGQGGIWLVIEAVSPEQVQQLYPKLIVYSDKPSWMSQKEKDDYMQRCREKGFWWNINAQPTGWLKQMSESVE